MIIVITGRRRRRRIACTLRKDPDIKNTVVPNRETNHASSDLHPVS